MTAPAAIFKTPGRIVSVVSSGDGEDKSGLVCVSPCVSEAMLLSEVSWPGEMTSWVVLSESIGIAQLYRRMVHLPALIEDETSGSMSLRAHPR